MSKLIAISTGLKDVEMAPGNIPCVVINNDLNECYNKIMKLIHAVMNNGSKDYDLNFIRGHVEKLTS